jgi:hypothetical protein
MYHWLIYTASLFSVSPDTVLPNVHLKTIVKPHDFFTTDKLGNIYLVNKDVITKYNANGDSLSQQSYKTYGKIDFVDATQALRTLVFYREQLLVLTLDNTLSPQNDPVDLTNIGKEQVTLVAASVNDNNIWLFDQAAQTLTRVDKTFKDAVSSGNLTNILGYAPVPDFMIEAENRLYLNVPDKGVIVFDMFGTYIKTIPLINLHYFDVSGDNLYYLEEGKIYYYNMMDFDKKYLPIGYRNVSTGEPGGIKAFGIKKNRLYIESEEKINIYEIFLE